MDAGSSSSHGSECPAGPAGSQQPAPTGAHLPSCCQARTAPVSRAGWGGQSWAFSWQLLPPQLLLEVYRGRDEAVMWGAAEAGLSLRWGLSVAHMRHQKATKQCQEPPWQRRVCVHGSCVSWGLPWQELSRSPGLPVVSVSHSPFLVVVPVVGCFLTFKSPNSMNSCKFSDCSKIHI